MHVHRSIPRHLFLVPVIALILVLGLGSRSVLAAPFPEEALPGATDQDAGGELAMAGESETGAAAEATLPAPPRELLRPSMGPLVAYLDTDGDIRFPATDEKWIDVDLSEQKVIAFEGPKPIRSFIISSGLPGTPTVTGEFRIRAKVRSQTMSGGDPEKGTYYNLPNVQWVQYFYQDYSFHGTYWHNNFGRPMSHGCINMTNEDAKWLFEWATPEWNGKIWQRVAPDEGTLVIVHE